MIGLIMKTIEENPIDITLDANPERGFGGPAEVEVRGMRKLKANDLRKGAGSELPELIVAKLHSLDRTNFTESRVSNKARLLLELLRDSLGGRYPHLSMLAFADILLAMHHFIEVHDEIPDTQVGGLADDLRKLDSTSATHGREIEAYRRWRDRR